MPHEILVSSSNIPEFLQVIYLIVKLPGVRIYIFPSFPHVYGILTFSICPYPYQYWCCQTLGLFQSDWCDMAFHLYSISSFLMVGYFWLSLQWFACIYPSHIFYWTFCYCFVRVLFNIVKIVTNVSEVFFFFLSFQISQTVPIMNPSCEFWILIYCY